MSVAGSWMWLVLRPVNSWRKMVGIIIPSTAGGVAMALSLCTAYELTNLHHKMVSAFAFGLGCMSICGIALKLVESEGFNWAKQGVKRFFGFKDAVDPPPEEDGGA